MRAILKILLLGILTSGLHAAGAVISVGSWMVAQDAPAVQIPVQVTGATNEFATDMAGIVQMGGSFSASPTILNVSYASSVWTRAAGGYLSFAGFPLTNSIYDPNVSLMAPNQRVSLSNGVLFTMTVSVTNLPPGAYPIRMGGVVLSGRTNNTQIRNGTADVALTLPEGTLVVRPRLRVQQLSPNTVTVRFKSFVGKTNVLESSSSLLPGSWENSGRIFPGTGHEVVWSESVPANSSATFYRLNIQP